ncbi:hypothetical protein [Bradyrhizobium sp. 30]|uniref:hypothetical protein n=1 Tax=Bradyrhizobium sp. 30 TaxID=2782669 RepID=UPI001FFB5B71|nr:hypothetical protein [Bradyrhizobium sp. 30]
MPTSHSRMTASSTRVAHHSARVSVPPRCEFLDDVPREEGDLARRERANRMIHLAEDGDVQIANVAWHKPRHDLAIAAPQELVAAREAGQDQVNVRRTVPLLDASS